MKSEVLTMFVILVFFSLIANIFAAVFIDGPCPDVKTVDYFNKTAFAGKWFQIAKYQNDIDGRGDCISLVYKEENGILRFQIDDIVSKSDKIISGYVDYAPNAGTSGFLNLVSSTFGDTEGDNIIPLYMLDIVYDSYYISYECKFDKANKKNHVYAWISSRTNKLDGNAKKAVDKFLQASNVIDSKKLFWDHFDKDSCTVKS